MISGKCCQEGITRYCGTSVFGKWSRVSVAEKPQLWRMVNDARDLRLRILPERQQAPMRQWIAAIGGERDRDAMERAVFEGGLDQRWVQQRQKCRRLIIV